MRELNSLGEAGGARGEGEDHNVGGRVHWKGETRIMTVFNLRRGRQVLELCGG